MSVFRRLGVLVGVSVFLSACGAVYHSPQVSEGLASGAKVRVVPITAETALSANRSAFRPDTLPAIFSQTAGSGGGLRGTGALPDPAGEPVIRPTSLTTSVPPDPNVGPYRIGVGDVVVLATPPGGSSVQELSGLLAAQNRRQGYVVQADGSISLPDVGRIPVGGETVEAANDVVFRALVANQIEPSFSLEVAEFNSQRVSVGGAVASPAVIPIDLRPLYLNEALSRTGGVRAGNIDYVAIRLYRDGQLYQIPLAELYSRKKLQRIRLIDGDSLFVDTEYDLERAQAYFTEQIQLNETRRSGRRDAISELQTEIALQRNELSEARANYRAQVELGAIDRDYVYLTGEVVKQRRFPLPYNQTASLADAIYDDSGIPTITANISQIYVLRGSTDARDFGAVTAWKLDARNAASLLLATRFELRPNDIVFVAEQPITQWNRVITQLTPGLLNSTINALAQ